MAIAEMRAVVLDCPEPRRLAEFYRDLLGWEIDRAEYEADEEWITLYGSPGRLAFQRVADYRAPNWPHSDPPQQLHLDVTVDDLDQAEARVLAIGATKASTQPSEKDFRVFLDPAGHPFCLCAD